MLGEISDHDCKFANVFFEDSWLDFAHQKGSAADD